MAVQKETRLRVADNSGALELLCIHLVGSSGKRKAHIGDVIKCAVKRAVPGGTIKRSEVVTAVIVRTKKEHRREDGSYIRFGDNAAVIVKSPQDKAPVASRIFGPIARELRGRGYARIVSLAPEVV